MHPLDSQLKGFNASLESDSLLKAFFKVAVQRLLEESRVVTEQGFWQFKLLQTDNDCD
jgi:hypothetical protein